MDNFEIGSTAESIGHELDTLHDLLTILYNHIEDEVELMERVGSGTLAARQKPLQSLLCASIRMLDNVHADCIKLSEAMYGAAKEEKANRKQT